MPRTPIPTPVEPRCGRSWTLRLCGGAGLALWGVLAVGTLAALGRAHGATGGVSDDTEWRRLATENCAGWRVRHRVGRDAVAAGLVLDHLARRGRIPGVAEEVWVAAESAASRRLAGLGWRVRVGTAGEVTPARLEVATAEGVAVWTGRFQLGQTVRGSVAIWDLRALAELGLGRELPPVVPIGCATTPNDDYETTDRPRTIL